MSSNLKSGPRLPAVYLPHGGGPWHVMRDAFGVQADWDDLRAWLVAFGRQYQDRARSLLIISAHWEAAEPTVHYGDRPGMFYDYSGFPEETYRLSWPAPGHPAMAGRITELLRAAGFNPAYEDQRGYDHGTFVPMMVAFPEARLPVAQLSLVRGLDPATHFRLGQALQVLREEGVLIIGSGMSYHNMRGFGDPRSRPASEAFDHWLHETVELSDPVERQRRLIAWESAPYARECHPRSEHLVPLFVAAGAGGADRGHVLYSHHLMETAVSALAFGEA